jgi:hypothetical protein
VRRKDEQLLAEDEELEVTIGTRSTPDQEEVDQQAEESVQQGQEHGAASVGSLALTVKPPVVACPRVTSRLQRWWFPRRPEPAVAPQGLEARPWRPLEPADE